MHECAQLCGKFRRGRIEQGYRFAHTAGGRGKFGGRERRDFETKLRIVINQPAIAGGLAIPEILIN